MSDNKTLLDYLDQDEKSKILKEDAKSNLEATKDLLKENYNAAVNAYGTSAEQRKQAEAIRNTRLMKYLPEYQASMGLYGNGVSESALLEANARYRSNIGAIDAEAARGKAEALNAYTTGVASAENAYRSDLLSFYRDQIAREENQKTTDATNLYGQISANIQNGIYSSGDLLNYMNTWGDSGMTDQQHANLKAMASGVISADIESRMSNYSGTASDFKTEFEKYFTGGNKDFLGADVDVLNTFYQNKQNELEVAESAEKNVMDMDAAKVSGVPNEWKSGNNIDVTIDGVKLKMELGDVVALTGDSAKDKEVNEILNFSQGIADGGIFLFKGELYYRMGEQVGRLQKRKNDDAMNNGYRSLIGKIRKLQ